MPQREETRVMRRMIGVVAILPLLTTSASADVLCKSKKPASGRHPRGRRRRGDAARLSSRAPLAGLLLLGAVLQPAPARAFPGGLDASFGTSGTVITDFAGDADAALALVRQADGKLVAAGRSNTAGSADFALCRYGAEGELDPAFGTGGRVLTDFGGNRCAGGPRNARPCQSHDECAGGACVSSDDVAWALAVQPDGKIVVAGVSTGGGTMDFALARYDSDGALDTTFGSGGRVVTDLGGNGGNDEAFALVVQPDGRVVAAGASTAAGSLDFDFALARYNTD